MNNKKHILLSITGGSPAVLTETLYGIYKNNLTWPDEIQVITTQYGEKQLRLALFEKNDQDNNVIEQLCADYGIENVPCFSSDQVHIVPDANNNFVDDARSEADQEALADYIVKAVAQLCDDSNNTIHASISGGRKTMTFYLGYAMTLFARKDDMLSHVLLTDPQYEISDFYYPTPYSNRIKNYKKDKWLDTQSSDVDVVLSNIPFIRQREHLNLSMLHVFSSGIPFNSENKKITYADFSYLQNIANNPDFSDLTLDVNLLEDHELLVIKHKYNEGIIIDIDFSERKDKMAFIFYSMIARNTLNKNFAIFRPSTSKDMSDIEKQSIEKYRYQLAHLYFCEIEHYLNIDICKLDIDTVDFINDFLSIYDKRVEVFTFLNEKSRKSIKSYGIKYNFFDDRLNEISEVLERSLPQELCSFFKPYKEKSDVEHFESIGYKNCYKAGILHTNIVNNLSKLSIKISTNEEKEKANSRALLNSIFR